MTVRLPRRKSLTYFWYVYRERRYANDDEGNMIIKKLTSRFRITKEDIFILILGHDESNDDV